MKYNNNSMLNEVPDIYRLGAVFELFRMSSLFELPYLLRACITW
jgi:hypothetical protein